MANLDARILSARRHLDDLLAERHELQTQQNRTHDPYILQLPAELASRIFTFCLQMRSLEEFKGDGEWYDDRTTPGSRPWKVASVCRGWRAIALSTPQLWTRIDVTLRNVKAGGDSDYLKFIRHLISRSGSLPLSFGLKGGQGIAQEKYLPLLDILNDNSARWYIVHLNTSPNVIPLLTGCGAPSDVLRTLSIALQESPTPLGKFPFHLAGGSPSLSCIYSSGLRFRLFGPTWSKVTHVTLSAISLENLFSLLMTAPELEDLYIELSIFRDETPPVHRQSDTPIAASKLRNIGIQLDPIPHVPTFLEIFRRLTLPNLQRLRLWDFHNILGLADLVARSSCDFSSLHIFHLNQSNSSLLAELSRIPTVQQLELYCTSIGIEDLLEYLASTRAIDSSGTIFLPNLERFWFTGFVSLDIMDWSLIPPIFQPEGEWVRPFNELVFTVLIELDDFDDPDEYYIPEDDIESLQSIIDRGFVLSVKNESDASPSTDFIETSRRFHAGLLEVESDASSS